jgi:hypothetical protein
MENEDQRRKMFAAKTKVFMQQQNQQPEDHEK